jgi:hypothetical protein
VNHLIVHAVVTNISGSPNTQIVLNGDVSTVPVSLLWSTSHLLRSVVALSPVISCRQHSVSHSVPDSWIASHLTSSAIVKCIAHTLCAEAAAPEIDGYQFQYLDLIQCSYFRRRVLVVRNIPHSLQSAIQRLEPEVIQSHGHRQLTSFEPFVAPAHLK